MNTQQLAEAFSSHRLPETYSSLAETVRWVVPGHDPIKGKASVVAACGSALAEFEEHERITFERFVSVGSATVAAVDAIERYVTREGNTSVVSSSDFYEFDHQGCIVQITSYAVELGSAD